MAGLVSLLDDWSIETLKQTGKLYIALEPMTAKEYLVGDKLWEHDANGNPALGEKWYIVGFPTEVMHEILVESEESIIIFHEFNSFKAAQWFLEQQAYKGLRYLMPTFGGIVYWSILCKAIDQFNPDSIHIFGPESLERNTSFSPEVGYFSHTLQLFTKHPNIYLGLEEKLKLPAHRPEGAL